IILCDLMMPELDGKQFIARVRNNKQISNIPIVVLTAIDSDANEVELLQLGADDFVSKGASSSVLVTRLQKALKEKR
ncbi:MAG: response regulator, partial [Candidatus Dadabacteria bacterium]